MEFPTIDSFAAVRLCRTYTDSKVIPNTGIYYNTKDKTFDCWHVRPAKTGSDFVRVLVCRLSEETADDSSYEQANKILIDYNKRVVAK